jgi:hypothetical protein
MDWFDIMKDATAEGERFFDKFMNTMMEYFSDLEDSIITDIQRHELSIKERMTAYQDMDEPMRSIAKPLIESMIGDSMSELEIEMKEGLAAIRRMRETMVEFNKEAINYPIGVRLMAMRTHIVEDKELADMFDVTELDRLIHELGFEGQGLE